MEVPIQHIIGTVCLIGLLVSVGLAYNIITDSAQTEVRQHQLSQISQNVALSLVEIVTLANFGNSYNGTMTRSLNLPTDLAGKAYAVQICNDTSQQDNCFIKVYLAASPTISATSIIPIQASQSGVSLRTDSGALNENQNITYGPVIYGGSNDTVVWAWKGSGTTWAGLGRLAGG